MLSFRNSITQVFSRDTIHSLRSKYLNFPITPKIKEMHFKILNGVYPSNEFLRQRFGFETNKCTFCEDIETTDHLFFQCVFTEALWTDIHDWLHTKILLEPFLHKDILYGFVSENKEYDFLINNVLILGKFHIHKCKYRVVTPRFCVFHNEFLSFIKALKLNKSKPAMKLSNLIEKYDLKEKP